MVGLGRGWRTSEHFRKPKTFWNGFEIGCSLQIISPNGQTCFRPNGVKRFHRLRCRFIYTFGGRSRFHLFFWFRGFVNTRVAPAGVEDVGQYLFIARCVWSVVNKYIAKSSLRFLIIGCHESLAILIKHAFGDDTDLFSIARTSEKSHVLSIPTDIRVELSLRKHVLQQEYDTRISVAALSEQTGNDGTIRCLSHQIVKH